MFRADFLRLYLSSISFCDLKKKKFLFLYSNFLSRLFFPFFSRFVFFFYLLLVDLSFTFSPFYYAALILLSSAFSCPVPLSLPFISTFIPFCLLHIVQRDSLLVQFLAVSFFTIFISSNSVSTSSFLFFLVLLSPHPLSLYSVVSSLISHHSSSSSFLILLSNFHLPSHFLLIFPNPSPPSSFSINSSVSQHSLFSFISFFIPPSSLISISLSTSFRCFSSGSSPFFSPSFATKVLRFRPRP
ncbi:unnamed protein product [Acanthosepion pharaonis]|uniref:Uncharacterized protein n=1 Tax=Acanthosepion pharaonis TaxID=158019 RepID=A0A812AWE8_ACAPH|nr:unnamed protein product [Sepia pharaonis]